MIEASTAIGARGLRLCTPVWQDAGHRGDAGPRSRLVKLTTMSITLVEFGQQVAGAGQ